MEIIMAFIVEDKGGAREVCPSGNHLARCYRIVDLGTQKKEFKGTVKFLHEITLYWEIHGIDFMKDGRPFGIFKNYTMSWASLANLRIDLQAWRGKPFTDEELRRFDLKTILDQWCMLNVIENKASNGNTYANIKGITPVPKVIRDLGYPKGVNPVQIFQLDNPDMVMFEGFHDKLKEKIMQSPEWQKSNSNKTQVEITPVAEVSSEMDDDIPF
jgi:hypothetical protein